MSPGSRDHDSGSPLLTYAIDHTSRGPQKHPPNRVKGRGQPFPRRGGRGRTTAGLPRIGPRPDSEIWVRQGSGRVLQRRAWTPCTGCSVSPPIPLTAFILTLASKGGVRKGAAFIFGLLLSLVAESEMSGMIATGTSPNRVVSAVVRLPRSPAQACNASDASCHCTGSALPPAGSATNASRWAGSVRRFSSGYCAASALPSATGTGLHHSIGPSLSALT